MNQLLQIELLLTYYISSSSTSYGAYSWKTRSQVIKQQGLLFIYTNVYMLVKMFDQLIDQALTRSPVKRAHSHTIHQVFTRNNVQHETTFTDDDIGYTGSLFDWETNIQGRKFYCLCTNVVIVKTLLFLFIIISLY